MRLFAEELPRACRRWRRALWDEVDGGLSAAQRQAFETHLADCAACRAALAQARRLDGALAGEPLLEPARDFEEQILLGVAVGLETSGPVAPSRTPSRTRSDAEDRAAEEAADWWVLGGGLGAAGLVAGAAFYLVPRLALHAVRSAVEPAALSGGSNDILLRGIRALALSGQTIAGLFESPRAVAFALMAGVVLVTLGWVRLALSRSTS